MQSIIAFWTLIQANRTRMPTAWATYVTRTKFMGFPDYTTARQDGDFLKVYARLRFGRSDLGVNGARIADWLLQMGIQAVPEPTSID